MISIITPVYNGERFIESCIKVVIEQVCPDIEHIIIDGGSTDQTTEIIKRYADNYPHIRWLSQKDEGQSDAMNKGIVMARGDILGFLNVDDFYEPNVLNRISEIFKALPEPSLLIGNCNFCNEQGQVLGVHRPAKPELAEWLKIWKNCPWPINPSAYFYHKMLHQKVGLYKLDEYYSMDLDLLLRAVQLVNVKYMNETWGNFRFREGTKTSESEKTGEYKTIQMRLHKLYRKNLPVKQRLLISLKYSIYEQWQLIDSFFKKIRYSDRYL